MARRAFYSFHYIPDNWRASQVRNMGVVDGNKPATDNDWETIKKVMMLMKNKAKQPRVTLTKDTTIFICLATVLVFSILSASGCNLLPSVNSRSTTEEPPSTTSEEEPDTLLYHDGEDMVIPDEVVGLAVQLALEPDDIGPGWTRRRMDIKAGGDWIDQSFACVNYEGNLEFSQSAIEIIKVYPDIDSALLDSELQNRKYHITKWKDELAEYQKTVGTVANPGKQASIDALETSIEEAILDLPFWDEAYRHNDIILRKGNIIVSYKCGRGIRRNDPLIGGYTSLGPEYQLTSEQIEWRDREKWGANSFLYSLAEKAQNRISDYQNQPSS